MKESCSLPIVAPEFVCFDYFTCANAIVRANTNGHQRLVMSTQYINCYYRESSGNHKFVISMFDPWCEKQGLMQNQTINFLKEVYQDNEEELISTIKKSLLGGCYLFGYCNRKYVDMNAKNAPALFHYVATGFDDATREFTIYGLDHGERFVCRQVGYQTLVEAILDTDKPSVVFTMWRYNKSFTPTLQKPTIAAELKHYVSSTHSQDAGDKVFGLNAMTCLSNHFLETAKQKEPLNEAYLQQFAVHKRYMYDRIDYLAEDGILDPKWRDEAAAVRELGDELLCLCKRIHETRDWTSAPKVSKGILRTVEIESVYLPNVLKELPLSQ